jgi:hypothetical protein
MLLGRLISILARPGVQFSVPAEAMHPSGIDEACSSLLEGQPLRSSVMHLLVSAIDTNLFA